MADNYLAAYLNDHLAGSALAITLLEHFEHSHTGTRAAAFAGQLRAEIEADRHELEVLMGRLSIARSPLRRAGGWLSEKMTELKLRLDDPAAASLRQLEVFDTVSVGIEGKRLLWRSLQAAVRTRPQLAGTDYEHLIQRAEEQRQRLESFRLQAAEEALALLPPASA